MQRPPMRPPLAPGSGPLANMLSQMSNNTPQFNRNPDVPVGKSATWDSYFDRKEIVKIGTDSFTTYHAGNTGPLVVLFHGGGHTSLSWALVTSLIKQKVRVMAFDCRAHGQTVCQNETDCSKEVLVKDALALITHVWNGISPHHIANAPLSPELAKKMPLPFSAAAKSGKPDILLVGHSMGGAIAAHLAATKQVPQLAGLMVLDVVEGTAMEALHHMDAWIAALPASFSSPDAAVDWAVGQRVVANRFSAQLSVPSQLRQGTDGLWRWRTNLLDTKPYWPGWFQGLSDAFLSAPCVKALLVAGVDRLDKPLTIAHMQGRFQLTPIAQTGHIIEEDQPGAVAGHIAEFVDR